MNCQNCKSDRILNISAKCSDLCFLTLGEEEHDGYVPYGLGIGGGDMISILLCMNCGTVQGTWPSKFVSFKELTNNCI